LNHYDDDYLEYDIGHMHFLEQGKIYYPFKWCRVCLNDIKIWY
jgi:hypothetical protein